MDKIRSLFRVRRQVVLAALLWLKTHNSRYYGGIQINSDRLTRLPEDDVPIEIALIIRNSSDEGLINQENSGYVPEEYVDVRDEGERVFRMNFRYLLTVQSQEF